MSVGGQSTDPLDLVPMYDGDTGLGVKGDYEASLIPTVPGDYTFHLTGAIHGTAVDETATSSDSTFNAANDPAAVQFPVKLPSLTEAMTRLDRLDARIAAVASTAPQPVATPMAMAQDGDDRSRGRGPGLGEQGSRCGDYRARRGVAHRGSRRRAGGRRPVRGDAAPVVRRSVGSPCTGP